MLGGAKVVKIILKLSNKGVFGQTVDIIDKTTKSKNNSQ